MAKKIIIASDSFKDSLSADRVCTAIAKGIQKVDPSVEILKKPLADGGEGTARLLTQVRGGQWRSFSVHDPLGRGHQAGFGWLEKEGLVLMDMAEASGIQTLQQTERNPLQTSTFGFGELLQKAFELAPQKIMIGIGGSATNDGGIGMAHALGYRFLDKQQQVIPPNGAALNTIAQILVPPDIKPIKTCSIEVLVDVQNPLYGPQGATAIFGPQKGASPEMVELLDQGMKNLARVIQRDLGKAVANLPGSGAAGGLGAGLVAFCDAEIKPGIQSILEMMDFHRDLGGAHLVITGEGKLDQQTSGGKLIQGICQAAAQERVPVVALCGTLLADYETITRIGLEAAFSILNRPMNLETALKETAYLLEETSAQVYSIYKERI